ncbi:MAG: hypothetical protein IIY98_00710 [Aeriscardovia sp.]|nr:hypothetical protein [Aeriscardovia sp.]
MTTPRWLDWDLFSGSACEKFILQLRGKGVVLGPWKGLHMGDNLFPAPYWPKDDDYSFNEDGSCEVKFIRPWYLDQLGKWAKRFLLFYDGGKLIFNVDNRDGSKRIDLSTAIDWERWCEVWNDGGITRGFDNFDPSPLSDEMFGERCHLSWDGKKITVEFSEEDKEPVSYTPAEFVMKAVYATAHRFESEFASWEWIFQKPDGWMKVVSDWGEFNDLLKKPHTIEYQTDQLQRSYDSSHGDFYQTEVKIAFDDGSALYGAASGVEENYPFIKEALGFKGDLTDDHCKFALPVPLLMCWLWY